MGMLLNITLNAYFYIKKWILFSNIFYAYNTLAYKNMHMHIKGNLLFGTVDFSRKGISP